MSISVKELYNCLGSLIEQGDGDKTVQLLVNYDHCNHIQDLRSIHNFEGIDWITLDGRLVLK